MIFIINIDSQKFSLNGIPYFKNFTPHVLRNYVRIINTYDTSFELVPFNDFSQFNVNGIVYNSVFNLQTALLPILYTRNITGNTQSNIPLFGKWILKEHDIGSVPNGITQLNDLASGRIDNDLYCTLGRYKNYTNDNNTDNALNYEILSVSPLNSN